MNRKAAMAAAIMVAAVAILMIVPVTDSEGYTVYPGDQSGSEVVTETTIEVDPDTGATIETVKESYVDDDGFPVEFVTVTVTDVYGGVTVTETATTTVEVEGQKLTGIISDTRDSEGNTVHTETLVREDGDGRTTVVNSESRDADGNSTESQIQIVETFTENGRTIDTVSLVSAENASGVVTVTRERSAIVEEDGIVTETSEGFSQTVDADGNTLSIINTALESVTDASGSTSYTLHHITTEPIEGGRFSVIVRETGEAGEVTVEKVAFAYTDDDRVTTAVTIDGIDIRTEIAGPIDAVDRELAAMAAYQNAVVAGAFDGSYGRAVQVSAVTEVDFLSGSLDAIAGSGAALTVVFEAGSMELDVDAMEALSGSGYDVTLSMAPAGEGELTPDQAEALGSAYGVVIAAEAGGRTYGRLGGTVTVTVPYVSGMGSDPSVLTAYRIAGDGTREMLETAYDLEAGEFTFVTDRFSLFAIDVAEEPDDGPGIPPFILEEDDRPVIVPPAVFPAPSDTVVQAEDDDTTTVLACAAAAAFAALLALLAVSLRRK